MAEQDVHSSEVDWETIVKFHEPEEVRRGEQKEPGYVFNNGKRVFNNTDESGGPYG